MNELEQLKAQLQAQAEEIKMLKARQDDAEFKMEQLSERNASLLRRQHTLVKWMEDGEKPKGSSAFAIPRRSAFVMGK